MKEKGKNKRWPHTVEASYSPILGIGTEPDKFKKCQALDISAGGLSILTTEEIKVLQLLQLRVPLSDKLPTLIALGEASYCCAVKHTNLFKVGIRFVGLLPENLDEIIQKIKESEVKSN